MTIPIIPGPFSFLAEAGEAAGAIGDVREEHRRYAREQAQKAMEHMDNLVQLGIIPASTLSEPVAQHLAGMAGYAPTTDVLPQPKEIAARKVASMTGSRQDIALGLPTVAEGEKADITGAELARVKPGTPEARAVAGVPSAEVAGAGEKAQVAGLTADALGATMRTNLLEGATRMLGDPKNAEFRRIAEMGAASPEALNYLLERLRYSRETLTESRRMRADNTHMVISLLQGAITMNRTDSAEWFRSLDQVRTQAGKPKLVNGVLTTPTQQDIDAAVNAWATANPMPTFESSKAKILDAAGLSEDDYQGILADGLELGDPKFAQRRKGKGGTPAPDPMETVRISLQWLRGAEPSTGGAYLGQAVTRGRINPTQAKMILTHMQRTLPDADFVRFKRSYDLETAPGAGATEPDTTRAPEEP